ncbi:tyrosine--tRNA ligase [Candidatus Bathyarchaeota archaeon]|nr:tyrosine--tRNA ligase [Candidatus Bathyarchaeota archaeon]
MDLEERLQLVKRNTQEVLTEEELRDCLETNLKPRAYWGFECSGFLHLGTGLLCGSKIIDLVNAGFDFTVFLADWHSWINNKLGGDMDNIRTGGEYFKHAFTALGVDPSKVTYRWASDIVESKQYWEKVIRIAKNISLQRVMRALPIMGREMSQSEIETAWLYYPCMQAADIFEMDLDCACAGIDQRKAHILAREAANILEREKPVCIHTPLLMGLEEPRKGKKQFDEDVKLNAQIRSKMSKSIPTSSIFIHDTPDQISRKIHGAFCPLKETKGNPVLEISKHILFSRVKELILDRKKEYGGKISFENYLDLEAAYKAGKIHPLDLKKGVADSLIEILSPVRDYFDHHQEILREMEEIQITR